jgi:hypothetical protein
MMAQNANNSSDQIPNFTDRLLKIFSEVKPGESITVLRKCKVCCGKGGRIQNG